MKLTKEKQTKGKSLEEMEIVFASASQAKVMEEEREAALHKAQAANNEVIADGSSVKDHHVGLGREAQDSDDSALL